MRVDILSGVLEVGRCDLNTLPARGDVVFFKGELFAVQGVRHNCDINRVQLLCESQGKAPVTVKEAKPEEIRQPEPEPEPELPQVAIRRGRLRGRSEDAE